MKSFFFIVGLLILSNEARADNLAVDAIVEGHMALNSIPGMGLAIIQNGLPYMTKGYGTRDQAQELNADQDTLFGIASVSKGFCAIICAQVLAEKFPGFPGGSVFDVPIAELAPDYNLILSDRYRSEQLNFRDLLSHRTCLNSDMVGILMGNYEDSSVHLRRQRYSKQVCPFRTKLVYNNHMFDLASDIIAHIAQKSYHQLVAELFNKLGMTSTRVLLKDDDLETSTGPFANLSKGYYEDLEGIRQPFNMELLRRIHTSPAAGGVFSSPKDMANYLMLHINLGMIGGTQIIPQEVMEWVREASNMNEFRGYEHQSPDGVSNGDFAAALGLFRGIYQGKEMISHGGNFPPYNGFLSFFPEDAFGVYTVSNGPRVNDHRGLHARIRSAIFGEESALNFTSTSSKKPRASIQPPKNIARNLTPQELVGHYGNAVEGELEVIFNATNEGKELYVHFGAWGTGFLIPTSQDDNQAEFNFEWDSDFVHDMLTGPDGIIPVQVWWENVDEMTFGVLGQVPIKFYRDASLDSWPDKIWGDESCSPNLDDIKPDESTDEPTGDPTTEDTTKAEKSNHSPLLSPYSQSIIFFTLASIFFI